MALNKLSQCLDSSQVKPLFQFFVPDALNDRNPDVRKCMLDAALATLNTHGKVGDLSQARRWGEGPSHPRSGEKAGLGQAAGCTMVPRRGPVLDVLAGRWPSSGFCLYFLGQKDPQRVLNCCKSAAILPENWEARWHGWLTRQDARLPARLRQRTLSPGMVPGADVRLRVLWAFRRMSTRCCRYSRSS